MLFFYGINNEIFERKLFFNELLSLLGIGFFFLKSFTNRLTFKIPKSKLYKILLVYILLTTTHLIVSVFWKTNWYFYFRNAVIFYASFTFFLGFYYFEYAKRFYHKSRLFMAGVFAFTFAIPKPTLFLDRYNSTVFFPFLFFRRNLHNFIIWGTFLVICAIYTVTYKSSTIIFTAFFLSIILFIPRYAYFKAFTIMIFLAFLIFFISVSSSLKLYKSGEYRLFGNVQRVYADNKLLQIDNNSSWRLILWYRVTVEEFPQNLVGLGYGTPLIPYKKRYDTAYSNHDDEHDAHVIGVHNTYLTVAVRLGIVYVFILYFIYSTVLREYYFYRRYYIQNQDVYFMIGFFAITIIGFFNLVLESPTVAALYWTFLGFVAKIIYNRKQVFREKSLETV